MIIKFHHDKLNHKADHYDVLHTHQLLRALTMYACFNANCNGMMYYYSIPQLYFRLRSYFPKMKKNDALAYSFILSGYPISSTYHHLYVWTAPFRGANQFACNGIGDKPLNAAFVDTKAPVQFLLPLQHILPTPRQSVVNRLISNYGTYWNNPSAFYARTYALLAYWLFTLFKSPKKENLQRSINLIKMLWYYMRSEGIKFRISQRLTLLERKHKVAERSSQNTAAETPTVRAVNQPLQIKTIQLKRAELRVQQTADRIKNLLTQVAAQQAESATGSNK
jgi:hypothetical protein